jgi:hypothetical protein
MNHPPRWSASCECDFGDIQATQLSRPFLFLPVLYK